MMLNPEDMETVQAKLLDDYKMRLNLAPLKAPEVKHQCDANAEAAASPAHSQCSSSPAIEDTASLPCTQFAQRFMKLAGKTQPVVSVFQD
jgi:hypothetical protein